MSTLLVASRADPASMTLYDAITCHRSWTELQCSMGVLTNCEQIDAFLLLIDELHVTADGLDEEVERQISGKVDNVVVLSKHYSSSGRPAMTVHPIGVTSGGSIGERGMSGGRFGTLVPPHPKIAHVIRALLRVADNRTKLDGFDVTLEATHHGPLLSTPTMYVEIGSSSAEWSDRELAEIWMDTLDRSLFDPSWRPSKRWILCIGGGHYAPRHKDVISRSNQDVGHILPSYSLPSESDRETQEKFSVVLDSAVDSMRSSRPGTEIVVHFDRKSMNSWQRNWISTKLSDYGIRVLRGNQIMEK